MFQNQPIAIVVCFAVCLALLLLAWVIQKLRSRAERIQAAPEEIGFALAKALGGDLSGARRILELKTSANNHEFTSAVVGLVAVLRAQGEYQRARTLLDQLGRKTNRVWVDELKVQLCLDSNDLAGALDLLETLDDLPVELYVATLARMGHWDKALEMYRAKTTRRGRLAESEANLLAGAATQLYIQGDEKRPYKMLNRAVTLAPDAFMVSLATEAWGDGHPKPIRSALRKVFARKKSGERDATASGIESSDLVFNARAAWEKGDKGQALGSLRNHLDTNPGDWFVRAQYLEYILERDEPKDWRAELAELVDLLKIEKKVSIKGYCQSCSTEVREPVTVCPNCNAIGTFSMTKAGGGEQSIPSGMDVGTRASELFGALLAESENGRSS